MEIKMKNRLLTNSIYRNIVTLQLVQIQDFLINLN